MNIKSLRTVSIMMAFICLVAMLPASGTIAFAVSSSDITTSDSDSTVSDSDTISDSDITASGSDVTTSDSDAASDSDAPKGLPVIITQPEDASIVCGENAAFSVKAEGDDLVYQWYYASTSEPFAINDGLEFTGTDTDTLTVISTKEYYTAFPETFNGSWSDTYFSGDKYFCRVSNSAGIVDSKTAVFSADHNDLGTQCSDIHNHWSKCTCSLSEETAPQRHAHIYDDGICTDCGISETAPRLAGAGRCDTAALISSSAFESAKNVVITSGNNYADALAGVPLAYALDAPILLLSGNAGDIATINEIARLKAENIYILGGTVAVNQEYEDQFKEDGYNVIRIAGASRYETAVEIAEAVCKISGDPDEIFFACSDNYPDALAISGIAAIKGSPVLYIASNGVLNEATAAFAADCGAIKATILGGPVAVAAIAEANISSCGIPAVQRIAGSSRYDTNLRINTVYSDILTGDALCIATGNNYPDALAGGVLAAKSRIPVMLVDTTASDAQKAFTAEKEPDVIFIFGGTVAVPDSVIDELVK